MTGDAGTAPEPQISCHLLSCPGDAATQGGKWRTYVCKLLFICMRPVIVVFPNVIHEMSASSHHILLLGGPGLVTSAQSGAESATEWTRYVVLAEQPLDYE